MDKDTLLRKAEIIRDETREELNTAQRVGQMFIDVIQALGSTESTSWTDAFEIVEVNGVKRIKAKMSLYSVGELTAYGADENTPSVFDDLPIASTAVKGIAQFHPDYFNVENGIVSLKDGVGGLDETKLGQYLNSHLYITSSYLSENKYLTESGLNTYLTANKYLTETSLKDKLDLKLDKSVWDEAFEIVETNGVKRIKAKMSLFSVGELTAYGAGDSIPSLWDSLPVASTTSKGIAQFNPAFFTVNAGLVTLRSDLDFGLNESELASYLTSNHYITETILSNKGYATELFVNQKCTALSTSLTAEIAKKWTTDTIKISAWDKNITDLSSHIADTVKHVTVTERTTWNNKLDKSVWDEAFEVVGTAGSRKIKAKLSLFSVGELTAYMVGDGGDSSLWDSLPVASTTSKGIAQFNPAYFTVNAGLVTLRSDLDFGLNESELASYLGNNNYAKKTDNVSSATKLQNARAIALSGAVTGSGSFDGTGNLTIPTTFAQNFDSKYVLKAGDTMTGTLNVLSLKSTNNINRAYITQCLAAYNNDTASVTGIIKITLPFNWISAMNVYKLVVYEYNDYNASEIIIGGYDYAGSASWYNCGYSIVGAYNKGVRLACDGSKTCILLGTTSTVWNYPAVFLDSVYTSFSGSGYDWTKGYSITLITSESNISKIVQLTDKMADKFVKKTGDTMTGYLTLHGVYFYSSNVTGSIRSENSSYLHYNTTATTGHYFNKAVYVNGEIYAGSGYNQKVWHAGNDGSGSGLDADLLDGVHNGSLTANWLNQNTICQYGLSGVQYINSNNMSGTDPKKNQAPNADWWYILRMNHANGGGYYGDIAMPLNSIFGIYWRQVRNGVNYGWYKLLDTNNYASTLDSRYVNVTGDTMSGTLNMNGMLTIKNNGKIAPAGTTVRTAGMYGVYDATKTGLIWSMGEGYTIDNNGAGFGNLYGFAYKHTNNATGGTMAGAHQAVWCQNGTPYVALGENIWAKNQIIAQSYITSNSGYIVAKTGWFQNDTINVGLYNSNRNIRWYATVNTGYADGTGWYADSSIRARDFVTGTTFLAHSSKTITVTGDKDTFYPVKIQPINNWNQLPIKVCISKKLGSTSNSGWAGNHSNGTSSLIFCWEGRIYGWDGNSAWSKSIIARQDYAQLIGNMLHGTNGYPGWVVWLRGGTATYEIYSTYAMNDFTVYYSQTYLYGDANNVNKVIVAPIPLADAISKHAASFIANYGSSGFNTAIYSRSIELYGNSSGYINFYYADNSAGYTSRIIESASGRLAIPGKLAVGNQNGVSDSYALSATSFYCSGAAGVNGTFFSTGRASLNGGANIGYTNTNNALSCSSFICNTWIRTNGQYGWYSEAYNGGIYMIDSTWVRTYNNKSFFTGVGTIRSDAAFDRQGYTGTSWFNGYGAYNVAITNNNSQTPLILAYRAGSSSSATGSNRLFSMELYNTGSTMYWAFGGAKRFEFTNTGNFVATGEVTAYSASDIRLKTHIRPIDNPFKVLKRVRPVLFKWNKTAFELNQDRPCGDVPGMIAQWEEAVLPAAIHSVYEKYLGIKYESYIPYLVAGVNEHETEIQSLKKRIRELEREVEQLKVA